LDNRKVCIEAIEYIRKDAPKHDKVLITADSKMFLDAVKDLQDVYIVQGETGHIDFNCTKAASEKMFLDFFLISEAVSCYQVRSGMMYGGEFSRYAALSKGKPFKLYELE